LHYISMSFHSAATTPTTICNNIYELITLAGIGFARLEIRLLTAIANGKAPAFDSQK